MARAPLDIAQMPHKVEFAKMRENQRSRADMIDFLEQEIVATEAESPAHPNLAKLRAWLGELHSVR